MRRTTPSLQLKHVSADVPRQLRPGLISLLISMIIAASALVLFCYSLGLSLKELAGDAAASDQPLQVKRAAHWPQQ